MISLFARFIQFLSIASAAIMFSMTGPFAASKEETIKSISDHFVSVPSMSGEFIQFGPNGEQTGGKFFIKRPGKIRFNYEDPSPIRVISNGKTVAVNNRKLKTWDYYPLGKTPLKLLLDDKLEVDSKAIRSVTAADDITTVVMGDEKIFGNSEITLLFDPETFDLRQWTIKDAQGKETSVMVFNVEKNVDLSNNIFRVNQLANQRRKSEQDDK